MSHREKQLKKSAVRVVESDLGVIDLPYLLLTLLLVAIGLLVLFSASYARAYYETKNAASVFVNQLIFAVMGIGVKLNASMTPYNVADMEAMQYSSLPPVTPRISRTRSFI